MIGVEEKPFPLGGLHGDLFRGELLEQPVRNIWKNDGFLVGRNMGYTSYNYFKLMVKIR